MFSFYRLCTYPRTALLHIFPPHFSVANANSFKTTYIFLPQNIMWESAIHSKSGACRLLHSALLPVL